MARKRKYDWCERALASIVYYIFDRKTGSGGSVNEKIARELHKKVIKKFKTKKIYARVQGNILAAELAEMGLLSSKNKKVKYLLCVIDAFNIHGLNLSKLKR